MHLVPRPSQFGSGYRAEWSAVLVRSYIVPTMRALVELSTMQVLSVWVYTIAEHRYALHFFIATYAINLHTLRLPPNSIHQFFREISRHLRLYRFDKFRNLSSSLYYEFIALNKYLLNLKQ